jgi:hypothetical protein
MGDKIPNFDNKLLKFPVINHKPADFVHFFTSHNLSLDIETRGIIKDGHCGYVGNKMISEMIYNQLIDYGYLKSNKVEITDHTIDVIFEPNGYDEFTNFSELTKIL